MRLGQRTRRRYLVAAAIVVLLLILVSDPTYRCRTPDGQVVSRWR